MAIGDLLASISGDGSSSSNPTPTLSRRTTLPKRKADDDAPFGASKTPRVTTLSSTVAPRTSEPPPRPYQGSAASRAMPSRPLDRSNTIQRPLNSRPTTAAKPNVLSSRPMNGGNKVQKPAAPNRPSPGPSSAPVSSRAPKKGSFAEILSRGQRAQAVMGQVGRIQHKKVEKKALPVKKEDVKPDPRNPKKKGTPPLAGYSGTAKAGQRAPPPAAGNSTNGRNGKSASSRPAERQKAPAEPERKPKKVAPTSGYSGTARPKPGATARKANTQRGGALLNVPPPRPKSSRSRYERDEYEDDDDMDGFIDYDDEEEEGYGRPKYDYNSDASSDMEAGMDDIDDEERRAEFIARKEDVEEQKLEQRLKAEKEARRREFEARRGRR